MTYNLFSFTLIYFCDLRVAYDMFINVFRETVGSKNVCFLVMASVFILARCGISV